MGSLGFAFGETIIKDNKVRKLNPDVKRQGRFFRFYFFILIFVFGIAVITIRLFSLTVISGSYYKKLAGENRIREITLPAPRGIIYDRNKIPLVRNIPKNLFYTEGSTREYIYGEESGNLLGYVGEVGTEELSRLKPYKLKDIVGKVGIEKAYDEVLRGKDGVQMYEVDAKDIYKRTLGRIEPKAGENLILNIELELQKKAAELLKDKKGAVLASDPVSGAILVIYSSPSYDANKILREENLDDIFKNPDNPLFNRAISGLYPPGSTFKIITSIAALSSGAITSDTTVEDSGIIRIGENYSYANWYFTQYGKTEGEVNLIKAIQRSNDIYFYKAGERTGIRELAKWAKNLGVGKILDIDIESEEKGLMPDPDWRKKVFGEEWFLGNTYITAIGQGDILTTPLQVNFWTNVIANGGKLCRPNIAKTRSVSCQDLGIEQEFIKIIREGMVKACEPGGTGWPMFNFSAGNPRIELDGVDFLEGPVASSASGKQVTIKTACKTGTAEFGDPKGKTHAWFTVFAPVFKPQISLTVLVEAGGEGSSVAGPIARDLLKTWFER